MCLRGEGGGVTNVRTLVVHGAVGAYPTQAPTCVLVATLSLNAGLQHIHVVARCVPLVCTQRCALCGFSNYVRGLPQGVHQIGNALQCGACKKEGRKEERKKGGEGRKEGSRFLISIHRACVGLVTELRSVPCSTCIPFTYLYLLTWASCAMAVLLSPSNSTSIPTVMRPDEPVSVTWIVYIQTLLTLSR